MIKNLSVSEMFVEALETRAGIVFSDQAAFYFQDCKNYKTQTYHRAVKQNQASSVLESVGKK